MKIVKAYDYLDESGQLLYQVVRYEPKGFRQGRPDGQGGHLWDLEGVARTLYRLPELLESSMQDFVFVTEGEKDCDALNALGLTATTSGGSNSWKRQFAEFFKGRLVCITPDNDPPGRSYAQTVADSLCGVAGQVRILNLPGLGQGQDLSDWLDSGGTVPELLDLLDQAEPFTPDEPSTGDSQRDRQNVPMPVMVCLESVEPQKVEWLWDNRFPLSKLSLVVGDPGLGKSFLTLYLSAQVTTGRAWPDDPFEHPILKGSVIILSAEDDVADTIVPRLKSHQADLRRIRAIEGVTSVRRPSEGPGAFNLTQHLPALEQAISQTPETRLVIIDPLTAYLGGTDSHKNAEVRAALAPLARLACEHRVAIVGVSHLSKNQGAKAIYRTMGSLAFAAAARAVWVVTRDRDNPDRRLLTPVKANLSLDPGGLAYSIIDGAVAFEPDRIEITTDEALGPEPGGGFGAVEAAKEFLAECLKDGPVLSVELHKQARAYGLSERTLTRAKRMMEVRSFREKESWFWTLEPVPF
ncbi:MAG: AAA family ATPase [Phycisphaerales bacterium]|nr:MAG: AAA family ATPase [Phycisphaerales bacterium]